VWSSRNNRSPNFSAACDIALNSGFAAVPEIRVEAIVIDIDFAAEAVVG
jgi:hypothetical protein